MDTGTNRASDPNTSQTMSEVSRLIVYVTKLDGAAWELIRPSLPYLRADHDSYVLLEDLNRLTEGLEVESVTYAGQALLKMLARFHPTYRREDIVAIVERLYATNDKECRRVADDICDSYAQKGIFFLKDVYDRNHGEPGVGGVNRQTE